MADPANNQAVNADRAVDEGIGADVRAAIQSVTEKQTPAPTGSRARDDSGRFVANQDGTAQAISPREGEDPSTPLGEQQQEIPEGEQPQDQQAQPDDGAQVPQNWSQADKEMFSKLPPDGQQFLLGHYKRMQASHTKAMQGISEFRKDYEPVAQALDPYKAQLRQLGHTPGSFVGAYLEIEKALHQGGDNAAQVMARAIRSYGIDLAKIHTLLGVQANGNGQAPQQQQQEPEYVDPQLKAALDKVAGLEKTLSGVVNGLSQREKYEQEQVTNSNMARLDTFAQEKDTKGNLKHPYFNEVVEDMHDLAQVLKARGQPIVLEDLYERAVNANPATRTKLLADMQRAQQRTQTDQARQHAQAARIAGSSVSGAPAAGPTPVARNPNSSLRDDIAEAARSIIGRA